METLCNSTQLLVTEYIKNLKYSLDNLNPDQVDRIVEILWSAYLDDKQVFIMGNGGSASTASHFACDLGKGTVVNGRKRLRVLSLNDNMAIITALSNDLNYDAIFKEQLINLVAPGDVVIAITASGNSPNILKAVEYARKRGAITVALTGFNGGELASMTNDCIIVFSKDYGQIEDTHLVLGHMISQNMKHRLASGN